MLFEYKMEHASRVALAALNIASEMNKDSAYEGYIKQVMEKAQEEKLEAERRIRVLEERVERLFDEISMMAVDQAWLRLHFQDLGYDLVPDNDPLMGILRGRRLKLVKLDSQVERNETMSVQRRSTSDVRPRE
jgi:phenylalanyl-tRNA synthetase beta subunit